MARLCIITYIIIIMCCVGQKEGGACIYGMGHFSIFPARPWPNLLTEKPPAYLYLPPLGGGALLSIIVIMSVKLWHSDLCLLLDGGVYII